MKKKQIYFSSGGGKLRKMTLIMKMTVIFLLCANLVMATESFGQEKYSFSLNRVTLEEALNQILQNSGYYIVYTVNDIRKIADVSLNMEQVTIEQALDRVLSLNGLKYTVSENAIVIAKDASAVKNLQSEQMKVQGTVKDEKGLPLPGASVYLKAENTLGVTTDIGGHFEFKVPAGLKGKVVLVISFIGMETVELPLDGREHYEISMKPEITSLDDVLITGYQTISRERATGAFDIVDKRQLEKPASDLSSRLIGTTAGVQATLTEDGKASLEIRGRSSLNANAQPLIVVDGFPVEGGFETINPNDVESVSILKDAAAASIWGARSGNGVIVVTTRKAAKGDKLNVAFNTFLRFRQKIDLDYANPTAASADQIRYEEMIFGKYGVALNEGIFSEDDVAGKCYTLAQIALNEARLGNISEDTKRLRLQELQETDYKDDVYKHLLRNPFLQQYNLSVSGGGERVGVMTSLLYEKDKTHYIGTQDEKYMLNMRMNSDICKWLKLDISGMFQYVKKQNNGAVLHASDENDIAISDLSPYEHLTNRDGSYTHIVRDYYLPAMERLVGNGFPYSDWFYNPLQEIRSRDRSTKDIKARFQAALTLKLWEGLNFSSSLQYEIFNSKRRDLYKEDSWVVKNPVNYYTEYNDATGVVGKSAYPTGQFLDQYTSEMQGYTFRNQVNFNRTFRRHDFNVVLGTELRHRRTTSYTSPRVYGYNDETLTSKLFPNGTGKLAIKDLFGNTITVDDYASTFTFNTDRFFSLYGNAAYTFDNKYTISGSVRTDASNFITDDPKYRYAPFWSVGGMWNLGQESFMSDYLFIDWLRLRLTYGYNGNVDTSTSFKPLVSIGSVENVYKHEITGSIASFGNPELRWEKVGSVDIGIDYSFWGGKLAGKLDYYRKYSKDLIATISISSANGTTSQKLNNAEMLNSGIELEVGSQLDIIGKDIQWYGNVNYAYNLNRIERLFVTDNSAKTYLRGDFKEGENASTIYAWHYAGVNKDGIPCVEEGSSPDGLRPMNTVYDNTSDATGWLRPQGVKVAPHIMGLTTGFKVYNFDLSLIVTGKFGHKFKRSSFNYPTMGKTGTSKIWVHKDVSKLLDGDKAMPPLLTDTEDSNQMYYDSYYTDAMDYLYHNANHIRFQELNLTWHISEVWLQKIGFRTAAVYGQINNLGLITANKYKNDPEFPEGTVKPERSFIVGVKFNF